MKQFKLILMCLGLITTLIACKKEQPSSTGEVDQDSIYAYYEVAYDEDTDMTTVFARFHSDPVRGLGSLDLDENASVSFNGDILPYTGRSFNPYQKEYEGQVSGTFVYEDIEGNVFENEVPVCNAMTFSEEIETLSRTQEHTFQWEGIPFEEAEELSLSYPTQEGNATTPVEGERTANNELTLYPGRLSKMAIGPAEFIIERQRIIEDIEGTTAGGKITVIYRTTPKKVFMVD